MNFVLETTRLVLRPFLISDTEALFLLDSNPNVHRYLGNKPVKSIEECDKVIQNILQQYDNHGIGRFAILLKETNECIGWAGLKFITEPENKHVNYYDIGYRLQEAYWGKGYGQEAAKAWFDYAINVMKIETLFATAHIDNIASNNILKKIGLQQRESYLHQGIPCYWYEFENNKSAIENQ